MIKKVSFLFAIVFLCSRLLGQGDSLLLVKGNWTHKEIGPGVSWKSIRFMKNELFNSNQNINIIEILPGAENVRLAVAHSDSLETTSQMARTRNALAAINGSFFKMRGADPDYHKELNGVPKLERSRLDRNRSIVYLREHDSLVSENVPAADHTRKRHQQGSIAINNNQVYIIKGDSLNLESENTIVAHDVLSTGPVMLLSGINQPIQNDAFCNDRHPRTALGKKADGTIMLFVVDGRAVESAGMSIPELQRTMRWAGCVDAINLDGGGSTTMYIRGQPDGGVVNYPTDNKKFDHQGEREVANAILLLQR